MMMLWATRRSPAGWLGIVMLLASLYWITTDLLVSALVGTVHVPARCGFNMTSTYEVAITEPFFNFITPHDVGNLHDLVMQSQVTSISNGGLSGIYHKVNSDLAFRADDMDVIGKWDCTNIGQDISYPAYSDLNNVTNDLSERGVIFHDAVQSCWDEYPGVNQNNHLLALSADASDFSNKTFQIRAALDLSIKESDPKVMRIFDCTMDAPPLEWILARIPIQTTFSTWCNQIRGKLYENSLWVPPVAQPGQAIASVFDAMIMIATANVSQTGLYTTLPVPANPTQGCLAPRAQIPLPVIVLFFCVTMSTVCLLGYWVYLTLALWRLKSRNPRVAKIIEINTPSGLLGWIKQAVYETGSAQQNGYNELRGWMLFPSLDNNCLQLSQSCNSHDLSEQHPLQQATPVL